MADLSLFVELIVTLGKVLLLYFQAIKDFFFPTYKSLKNELVLITGAASGIGRLQALGFAKEGANLILWDIDENNLSKVASEIKALNVQVHTYKCDVSKRSEVYQVAGKVQSEAGHPTILVNNAGIVSGKLFLETPDESIEKTFQVNTLSNFWTLKAFLPKMLENNHGHIVTISSASSFGAVPYLVDYSASKAASFSLDEGIRREIQVSGKTGVRTTCVCPYFINTGMFEGASTKFPFLIPFLEQQDVADKIIDAVKRNQQLLVIPNMPRISFLFRAIYPTSCNDVISDFFGISECMKAFRGRVNKKKD